MKTHQIALVLTLALLVAGCSSTRTLPKDHVRISASTVYAHGDEQIWQLDIETAKREYLRIEGPHFSIYGNTAHHGPGRKNPATASFQFVGSCITYNGHTYARIFAEGCGGTTTLAWEYPKGTQLTNILNVELPNTPMVHPLNRDLRIGIYNLEEMRLLVGPAVHPMKSANYRP
jgi:uncharacterized protein YceK